jgi:hypothetical protein
MKRKGAAWVKIMSKDSPYKRVDGLSLKPAKVPRRKP